jgi:hypothetical protein
MRTNKKIFSGRTWTFQSACDFILHFSSSQQLFQDNPSRSNFTYELSNSDICVSHMPHALIFAISKSMNYRSRDTIRRTWGQLRSLDSITEFKHLHLKLLFLIDIDENYMMHMALEQNLYHDLVQVHLPQYYTLSTYRDMAILHWTETFCSQALLTVKTDDDVFLNIFLLANILTSIISQINKQSSIPECVSISNENEQAIIYGVRIDHAQVVRHSHSLSSDGARYIVTSDEYPCSYYPNYMSGFGYIITRLARVQLLCAFFRLEKLFHMSDVYVTGILAEYLSIQRRHLPLQINSRQNDDCDLFFTGHRAYACASSNHYDQQSSARDRDMFRSFNRYWHRIYEKRLAYIRPIRLY